MKISKREIKEVFQKNILIRQAICNDLKLNCYTFLQPFPNIHGFYNKKLSKEPQFKDPYLEKYDLLFNTICSLIWNKFEIKKILNKELLEKLTKLFGK